MEHVTRRSDSVHIPKESLKRCLRLDWRAYAVPQRRGLVVYTFGVEGSDTATASGANSPPLDQWITARKEREGKADQSFRFCTAQVVRRAYCLPLTVAMLLSRRKRL